MPSMSSEVARCKLEQYIYDDDDRNKGGKRDDRNSDSMAVMFRGRCGLDRPEVNKNMRTVSWRGGTGTSGSAAGYATPQRTPRVTGRKTRGEGGW